MRGQGLTPLVNRGFRAGSWSLGGSDSNNMATGQLEPLTLPVPAGVASQALHVGGSRVQFQRVGRVVKVPDDGTISGGPGLNRVAPASDPVGYVTEVNPLVPGLGRLGRLGGSEAVHRALELEAERRAGQSGCKAVDVALGEVARLLNLTQQAGNVRRVVTGQVVGGRGGLELATAQAVHWFGCGESGCCGCEVHFIILSGSGGSVGWLLNTIKPHRLPTRQYLKSSGVTMGLTSQEEYR